VLLLPLVLVLVLVLLLVLALLIGFVFDDDDDDDDDISFANVDGFCCGNAVGPRGGDDETKSCVIRKSAASRCFDANFSLWKWLKYR